MFHEFLFFDTLCCVILDDFATVCCYTEKNFLCFSVLINCFDCDQSLRDDINLAIRIWYLLNRTRVVTSSVNNKNWLIKLFFCKNACNGFTRVDSTEFYSELHYHNICCCCSETSESIINLNWLIFNSNRSPLEFLCSRLSIAFSMLVFNWSRPRLRVKFFEEFECWLSISLDWRRWQIVPHRMHY